MVTSIAYEYGCPGSSPCRDFIVLFFAFLGFLYKFFFNARDCRHYITCLKTNTFLFIKIDRVIVTQVGFCAISPWSLSRFLSNHQKALLRWLLHLHSNFQLIP